MPHRAYTYMYAAYDWGKCSSIDSKPGVIFLFQGHHERRFIIIEVADPRGLWPPSSFCYRLWFLSNEELNFRYWETYQIVLPLAKCLDPPPWAGTDMHRKLILQLVASEMSSNSFVVTLVFVFLMDSQEEALLLKYAASMDLLTGKHAFLFHGLTETLGVYTFGNDSSCISSSVSNHSTL